MEEEWEVATRPLNLLSLGLPVPDSGFIGQLACFGYRLHVVSSVTELAELDGPLLVLCEMRGGTAERAAVPVLQRYAEHNTVLLAASKPDLPLRLAAFRCGARECLSARVSVGELVERLDFHHRIDSLPAARVLIIEDDASVAGYYAAALTGAGFQVHIETDPMRAPEALDRFNPNLLVLDMHMPGCTGIELAAAIRQQDIYSSLPIIFLSGERDLDVQLRAMEVGGDEFMVKPVAPGYLVRAIRNRNLRHQILHDQLLHDSLTGLLRHGALYDRLRAAFSLSQRDGKPLTVAMVDLDHFKMVNDRYGHMVGDGVLRSIGHLFSRRLRSVDIAARYGGEEFVLLLQGMGKEESARVLNRLREDFAGILHDTGGITFNTSFSAGVCDSNDSQDPLILLQLADLALYEAKAAGRNQVTIYRR